jgi:putative FmdB family regulatory protein
MPVYDFKCNTCNIIFDDILFNPQDDDPECPKCGSKYTIRMIGMPSNWHPAGAVFTNKNWDLVQKQAGLSVKNNDDH